MIKNVYPNSTLALNLNFKSSCTMDPRITFTRQSAGTYVNPMSGLVQTVESNAPRVEREGLLIEEARTNLNMYSRGLDGGNWASIWATSGNNVWSTNVSGVTDPAGNNNAAELKCNGTAANWSYRSYYGGSGTIGTQYTFSLHVKPNGITTVKLGVDATYAQGINTFTLTGDGSVTPATNTNATIKHIGNGWYRCSTTYTLTHGTLSSAVYVDTPGDGTSGIYVWGAQQEVGPSPSSYITTTSNSTVTRNADVAELTGTNFSDWYNFNEGTFFSEFRHEGTEEDRMIWATSAGSGTSNGVQCFLYGKYIRWNNRVWAVDGQRRRQLQPHNNNSFQTIQPLKIAAAYASDVNSCKAGPVPFTYNTNSSSITANTNPPTMMTIASQQNGTRFLNGNLASLMYWTVAFADTRLDVLTT